MGCLVSPNDSLPAGGQTTQDFEENPTRSRRPWRESIMSLSQLTAYVHVRTGKTDIRVLRGRGEAHVGTGTMYLPVGTLEANDTAAHEAIHVVDEGGADSWRKMHYTSKAHELVYEFLRDGRGEYHAGEESPGLHVQWQHVNNDAMGDLLATEWIPQSLIGIYLIVGGYEFPENSMKPKARKLLAEFRALGYIDEARDSTAHDCAAVLVPKVIDLFAIPVPLSQPQDGSTNNPNGSGTGQPDPNGQQGQGQQGQGQQGQGQPTQAGSNPGGQDVNSLMNNATRAANKIQKFENAKSERAKEAEEEFDDSPGFRPAPASRGETRTDKSRVPKSLQDIGDAKNGNKEKVNGNDLTRIFDGSGGKGGNGIGYSVELAKSIVIVDRSR